MQCPYCKGTGELEGPEASFGTRVLAARTAARLTQHELAAKVGRSRAQIANIEAGRTDIPLSTLRVFAEALGVPAKDLIP